MGSAHTEALRRAGVPVVGVLGSSPEKSREAARSLGIPRAYADFAEVLADASATSVHLASPNRWHFEQAKAALLAGKHVLCEKPLAMTARESAELVALAKSRPRQAAGVNYNIRFYPLCLEARDRVRAGSLGNVVHICGSYAQDWLLHDTDYNWRVNATDGGELRAVADIGTHWLDLAQAISGLEVEAVCADLQTVHPIRRRPKGEVETFTSAGDVPRELVPVTTDDFGAILLRFRGGARGVVWVSQTTAGRKNALRLEIAGASGSLAWDSEHPDDLWLGHRDRANELLMRSPPLLGPTARNASTVPGGHAEGFADTFKQCFRAFYGYIAAGDFAAAPSFATFADGHRELVLCEAVLESHRTGTWIQLSEDSP